jgi:hypothetical protein
MNRTIIQLACLTLGLIFLAGCQSANNPQPPPDLQVQVDVPAVWRPMIDDDIAEAIGSIVRNEFRRQGYTGNVQYLRRGEEPMGGVPVLALYLNQWRLSRTGTAECVLSAKLRTADGETDLGLVESTEFTWLGSSGRVSAVRQLEIADAFEKSASNAIRDLYRRLADTALVPGLSRAVRR